MASTLPPTQAPANAEYAGDEINALILDPGTHTTRAGFAGEDTPKSVHPTSYAHLPDGTRLFGENAIHLPRDAGVEIRNPYDGEGVVEDWETASALWEYGVVSRLTGKRQRGANSNSRTEASGDSAGANANGESNGDGGADVEMLDEAALERQAEAESDATPLAEYPLLMSEVPWNPAKAREKTMEIAMEGWGVPAFFLARSGQLAAYSQGKATALVVDVGHLNTAVTALWEGMVLKKSIHHTPLASSYLSSQIRLMLASHTPTAIKDLTPHYLIRSKIPVDANTPAQAVYRTFTSPPSTSFRRLEEERILLGFKESVVQIWSGPGRLEGPAAQAGGAGAPGPQEFVRGLQPKPFEFPDGFNTVFGPERFKVAEGLFDAQAAYTDAENAAPAQDATITATVNKALQAADVDTRPHLLNNVVLTGAGSLLPGLPERLQSDLQALYPNPKVRVLANSNSVERRFGSWIGGSVLGSLGSFHQMWVSRAEYEEFGAGVVEKRCK